MGTDNAGIDVAAVQAIADRISAATDLLDNAVSHHLATLAFGGACAGRAYTSAGIALHTGLDRLAVELVQWSRATVEIAAVLRAGTGHYVDAELHAAARTVGW